MPGATFAARVLASSNVPGRGTVAVVEVESGSVAVGDRVSTPSGTAAEITAVEVFAPEEDPEAAGPPPQQLGLLLVGVDREDVPRGSSLSAV